MLIQIVAAVLLLAGSVLIFRALVALDAPSRPRLIPRVRLERLDRRDDTDTLDRAA